MNPVTKKIRVLTAIPRMETLQTRSRPQRGKSGTGGFTVVELAIVIALVAILSSILAPGMADIFARSSLGSAQQDLMQALRKAKIVARNQNTTVAITLTQGSPVIRLQAANGLFSQTTNLPSTITPTASATYRFNAMGVLDQTGTITLKSSRDATQTRTIRIRTLFGQLEAG